MGEEKKPEEEPPQEEVQPQLVWTPEMVKDLEKFIENLADKYLTFKKEEAEADRKYLETTTKHNTKMTLILTIFMVAITLGMAVLTFHGKVSGDALLFLVGTITGYIILFIQALVFSTTRIPPQRVETVE